MVDRDRSDDDHAVHHLLPERVDAYDVESVPYCGDNDCPDECRYDAAFPSECAGTTDNDRADREKFIAIASGGLDGAQAACLDRRRDATEQTTDGIDAYRNPGDRNTRKPGGSLLLPTA